MYSQPHDDLAYMCVYLFMYIRMYASQPHDDLVYMYIIICMYIHLRICVYPHDDLSI